MNKILIPRRKKWFMASKCWVFTFTVLWVSNTFWESFLREGIFNTKIISTNLLRHIEMILDHVIDLHVVDFRHLRTLSMMHQIDWIWNPSHKLKILLLKFSQDFTHDSAYLSTCVSEQTRVFHKKYSGTKTSAPQPSREQYG